MISLQSSEIAIVLDTSAVIRSSELLKSLDSINKTLGVERIFLFLPQLVLKESKYESTKIQLNLLLDKATVLTAQKRFLDLAREVANKVGLTSELSETDLEVIALALELRNKYERVYVATDDLRVQNVCVFSGIGIFGFKKRLKYLLLRLKKCSACGFEFADCGSECPSCGSESFRYVTRKTKLAPADHAPK